MFEKSILGERLKLLRLEMNLTQQQLGNNIGLSKGFIANVENSNKKPSLDMLISIANFFDVSVDYLLGRSENRKL